MKIPCQSPYLQSYLFTLLNLYNSYSYLKGRKRHRHEDREGSLHDSHFIFKSTMYKIAQHIQHKNNYLRRQNTTALHFWIISRNDEMLLYKTMLRNN